MGPLRDVDGAAWRSIPTHLDKREQNFRVTVKKDRKKRIVMHGVKEHQNIVPEKEQEFRRAIETVKRAR